MWWYTYIDGKRHYVHILGIQSFFIIVAIIVIVVVLEEGMITSGHWIQKEVHDLSHFYILEQINPGKT